jgi:Zn finger protein HypA/HybF involved in hydrogenase expression
MIMSTDNSQSKPEESAADTQASEAMYDRFTARAGELYAASQEKTREAMEKAMDAARQQLAAASEMSAEQGALFKEYMKRDLEQTEQDMRSLGKEAKEYLHPARLGAGALSSVARMLEATSSALQSLSRKAEEALQYNTGDITTAGTLTCVKCSQTVQLKRTTRIPPCPSCSGTHFRKGY